jgi:Asp-tRNA(Asn)/Glu-tRNA(Gln) amidotransferase A subunit family amidase
MVAGVVHPSPACARALEQAASALRSQGHEVVDVYPPSPYEALQIASALLNSDGCKTFRLPYRTGEWEDAGAAQMSFFMTIPRPVKYLYYLWVKYIWRDAVWAGLLKDFHPKTAFQQWQLVVRREAYKARWHQWWQEDAKPDFILTPPNATPALPHGAMKDAVSSCGYTFLFNLVRSDALFVALPLTRKQA